VFDYITFPSFTHTTGMTHFLELLANLDLRQPGFGGLTSRRVVCVCVCV